MDMNIRDGVPESMQGLLWNLVLNEDLSSVRLYEQRFTNQAVFLLCHNLVKTHNEIHNEWDTALMHINFSFDFLAADDKSTVDITRYMFYRSEKNKKVMIPFWKGDHFITMFLDLATHQLSYADSILMMNVDEEEIMAVTALFGVHKPYIFYMLPPQMPLQIDNVSCGMYAVFSCNQFCTEGTEWTPVDVDVMNTRGACFAALCSEELPYLGESFDPAFMQYSVNLLFIGKEFFHWIGQRLLALTRQ